MQTLRTGCSKAEQKFLPLRSPPRHTESVTAVVRQSQNFCLPPQTHRVRDGCSKAEPKFSPAADPLSGGAGPLKFNQLEMVTTCTYRFGEDRCTQFRVIIVTDTARPPTHPPATNTQTGLITIHCAAS